MEDTTMKKKIFIFSIVVFLISIIYKILVIRNRSRFHFGPTLIRPNGSFIKTRTPFKEPGIKSLVLHINLERFDLNVKKQRKYQKNFYSHFNCNNVRNYIFLSDKKSRIS